jgi:hypothetical protein
MRFSTITEAFEHIGPSFSLAPFAEILQPLIDEVLTEQGLDRFRQGALLMPKVLIWLVLALTIRRDLNCQKVLNWMLSGFRWLKGLLPAQARLVAEGTISHARVKMGIAPFRLLFAKLTASFQEIPADFYGRVSVAFDGSTGTMPDSEASQKNSTNRLQAGVRRLFPRCGWSASLSQGAHPLEKSELTGPGDRLHYSGLSTGPSDDQHLGARYYRS